MAKKQETKTASLKSVEEKLKALYQLQLIDSEVDRIRTVRGELPLEIEDLQDSIAVSYTHLTLPTILLV